MMKFDLFLFSTAYLRFNFIIYEFKKKILLFLNLYSCRDHAQQAIATMKEILPEGNLMLCSANRVKALILEEQALDSYQNSEEKKSLFI